MKREDLPAIAGNRRVICESALEALNLAREAGRIVRIRLFAGDCDGDRIAVGPGGVWIVEDDDPREDDRAGAGPGYPGPCPDGMPWERWLAQNNVD
jgi:hypothetical protein